LVTKESQVLISKIGKIADKIKISQESRKGQTFSYLIEEVLLKKLY
jgi:hypothetical protein